MDFTLDKKHEMARGLFRDFAETEVKPLAQETDETEQFPAETVAKMAKYGFMGIPVPKEYGGQGCDPLTYVTCVEELSKVCATTGVIVSAHTSLCIDPIMTFGTEEQKKKYVVPLAKGEKLGAFGLTEPGAGTDAQGCQTKAVLDGDEWVLNGSKCFITNGKVADVYIVIAITSITEDKRGRKKKKLLRIYRREGCSWILLRYKGKEDGYPWIFYIRADLRGLQNSKGCITRSGRKRFPNRNAHTRWWTYRYRCPGTWYCRRCFGSLYRVYKGKKAVWPFYRTAAEYTVQAC